MADHETLQRLSYSLVDDFYEHQGERVLSNLNKRTYGNLATGRDAVLSSIRENLLDYDVLGEEALTEADRNEVLSLVKKDLFGYGVIDSLIHDKTISDIKIHAASGIRIKREGKRFGSDTIFPTDRAYETFVTRLLERNKVNLGTANAIQTFTDAAQDDFILRLTVLSGLLIVSGEPCVVIRKIPKNKYTLLDLKRLGMFSPVPLSSVRDEKGIARPPLTGEMELDALIYQMIESRGILFTGKGASGKTSLMNAMISAIPHDESVMVCQENAELFDNDHPDMIVSHILNAGSDSKVNYSLGDLTRAALLLDLDRVIVGEVKEGSEALGLSKASMTGHKCWTSVHGESCEMAVDKMADYIAQATGYTMAESLRQLLGFQYVVHLNGFRMDEAKEITGYDSKNERLILRKVYPFEEMPWKD